MGGMPLSAAPRALLPGYLLSSGLFKFLMLARGFIDTLSLGASCFGTNFWLSWSFLKFSYFFFSAITFASALI